MVDTFSDNITSYSKRQVHDTCIAHELQAKVGYPSTWDLHTIILMVMLCNCPVTPHDLDNVTAIYGASVPNLKGGTVRNTP